jgi:ribosome biogenesis GTPase
MRVAVEHRGSYALLGATSLPGELAGRLRYTSVPGDLPVVGDWVAVRPVGGLGVIQAVLPRSTRIVRRKVGGPVQGQPIAANVDVVFVVTSADHDLSPRRIERYLTLVAAGGARPVVVLTKLDLSDDPAAALAALAPVTGGVPVVTANGLAGDGIEALVAHLPPGATGALIGSSGVGKSTICNAICGSEVQATRDVRLSDSKGRHTTTRRELIELPCGGNLIDTPGMRELGLWDESQGSEGAFADIDELAASCRFSDCTHGGEPGCAVAEALADGRLSRERIASREKLAREEAHAARQRSPAEAARAKRRWKEIHVSIRSRQKVDPKLRDL